MPANFSGTILDFGCATGDAIPILKKAYPNATLIGVDISNSAIETAIQKYGGIATFMQGSYDDIPKVDIIISSNVFEHLSDDRMIAAELIKKCKELYITVPFKEYVQKGFVNEHVNSYDLDYFKEVGRTSHKVYISRGWSQMGMKLLVDVYLKNLIRPLLGKRMLRRRRQIMFHFGS